MKIISLVEKVLNYKSSVFKKIKIVKSNNSKGNNFYVPSIDEALNKKFYLLHTLDEAIRDDIIHRKQSKNAHRYFYK